MTTFNLPDLGEGLPEAEIVAWLVKEGDRVQVDQPMLSVETAKAVVEVPSPFTGVITRLHARPGDTVQTGKPLVDFQLDPGAQSARPGATGQSAVGDCDASPVTRHKSLPEQGMVVGRMAVSDTEYVDHAIVGRTRRTSRERVRAAPAVRM